MHCSKHKTQSAIRKYTHFRKHAAEDQNQKQCNRVYLCAIWIEPDEAVTVRVWQYMFDEVRTGFGGDDAKGCN